MDCLAEGLLPKRPFFFSGIHHRLSFIVANGEVSAVRALSNDSATSMDVDFVYNGVTALQASVCACVKKGVNL